MLTLIQLITFMEVKICEKNAAPLYRAKHLCQITEESYYTSEDVGLSSKKLYYFLLASKSECAFLDDKYIPSKKAE